MINVRRWATLALALLLTAGMVQAAPWVLIDTKEQTLTVLSDSDMPLIMIDRVALGSRGAAPIHYRGDNTTPLGTFRITAIRPSRHFTRFFELNYPTRTHAEQAFAASRIDEVMRARIEKAEAEGVQPPQNTPLGGMIGIHGVGRGDMKIHQLFNWTDGCVAMSDQALASFGEWVTVGTKVVIR